MRKPCRTCNFWNFPGKTFLSFDAFVFIIIDSMSKLHEIYTKQEHSESADLRQGISVPPTLCLLHKIIPGL